MAFPRGSQPSERASSSSSDASAVIPALSYHPLAVACERLRSLAIACDRLCFPSLAAGGVAGVAGWRPVIPGAIKDPCDRRPAESPAMASRQPSSSSDPPATPARAAGPCWRPLGSPLKSGTDWLNSSVEERGEGEGERRGEARTGIG